jgi:hypothetical protein
MSICCRAAGSVAAPLIEIETMGSNGKSTLPVVAAFGTPEEPLMVRVGCRRQRPAALHVE